MNDSKEICFFILSGTLGTATGNLLFIIGIILAGPSYGVILTALYPVFAIGLNKIICKEKDNWLSKMGIVFSIISGALFVIIPSAIGGGKIDAKKIMGMACGLFAGFFWALDGLFLKIAMKKNPNVTQKEALAIKTVSVSLTTWIIFIPISMGINHLFKQTGEPFFNIFTDFFGPLFTNDNAWIVWIILLIAGLNIVILRILHTMSIDLIGQKLTAIIDTNNFIIPSLFALVLQFLPGIPGQEFRNSLFIPYLWLLLIPLCIGLALIIIYHGKKEIPNFKIALKEIFKRNTKE
ncbi:hypothetical protein C4B24_03270 [Mycoplasma marinum]|uniref:EamA domain-containing protein n=1 Tax=Mycoplasma marinum TaxID=1937190 RepID=A0A4V2NI47_9MOLU|nr:hypothetical protein C4B24_03270 [Mycoplasma marinum]